MKKYINKNIIRIKAFTMLEILMITIIVGVGLLSIVVAISKAKVITNNTKQHIIATQLAREGVEMVYQRRNTNLLTYPNNKSYCRLNTRSDGECDNVGISDIPWITEKNYIINSSFFLSGINANLNIGDGINTGETVFNICLSGSQRITCPGVDNQTRYGKFFRTIEGRGLYTKAFSITGGVKILCEFPNWGGTIPPPIDMEFNCGGNGEDPQLAFEFRFCSRVEYIGTKTGSVEICGVLTNFFE